MLLPGTGSFPRKNLVHKIDEMVVTIIISTAEVTGSTVSIVVVWACLGRLIGVPVRKFSVTTIFGKLRAL